MDARTTVWEYAVFAVGASRAVDAARIKKTHKNAGLLQKPNISVPLARQASKPRRVNKNKKRKK